MGRTQPSITQQVQLEEEAFLPFRRALRRSDQLVFDELFVAAKNHRAAAAMASRALPMESMLLAMLIEEHKALKHLQVQIEELQGRLKNV